MSSKYLPGCSFTMSRYMFPNACSISPSIVPFWKLLHPVFDCYFPALSKNHIYTPQFFNNSFWHWSLVILDILSYIPTDLLAMIQWPVLSLVSIDHCPSLFTSFVIFALQRNLSSTIIFLVAFNQLLLSIALMPWTCKYNG